MCGRFAQFSRIEEIVSVFFIDEIMVKPTESFNIAPSHRVPALVAREGRRILTDFQWGLVPHWARDPAVGNRMINARAEGVAEKPSFRGPFRSRRCAIVASGFYEWKKEGRIKTPYFIRLATGAPMAFAGLYDRWESPAGILESCTIITTTPNELLAAIHDRMPVILGDRALTAWLDPDLPSAAASALLLPFGAAAMTCHPVSTLVNAPVNNNPACIEPA